MTNKIHIDANIAKLLFYKYRNLLIPGIVIVISWGIFFQFVVPQFENFLSTKSQVDASEQVLATMTQNYNTAVSLNDADLQNLSGIAKSALPPQKDFAGILTAISAVVSEAGVSLNDYSFQVGNITANTVSPTGDTTVALTLTVKGTLDQVKEFLVALSKQFPLSSVKDIALTGNTTAIATLFYYSPETKPAFEATSPLTTVSTSQRKMLLDLAQQAGLSGVIFTSPTVTPSPTPQVTQTATSSARTASQSARTH